MHWIWGKVVSVASAMRWLACMGLRAGSLVLAATSPALAQPAPASVHADDSARLSPAAYRVINLGTGAIAAYPRINASGHVAFSLIHGDRTDGYFYDGNIVREMGSLGGRAVYVNDLNDAGQVAGTSLNDAGVENAFVWSVRGGMLDLRAAPSRGRSYGWAINSHGVVTGAMGDAAHPFRWSVASGVEDLGITPGIPAPASGRVINDAGLVAGVTTIDDEFTRVFVWTRSDGLIDIDTPGSAESSPVAVGAGGEVAGNRLASFDDGGERPFLWTRATGMVDLGTGRGSTASVIAMTPGLHIAGSIGYPDGRQRAMSWTRQGGMRELGTLGGRTSAARAVNARGQIVGFAEDRLGAMRAFVWSAAGGMLDLNRALRHAPPGLVLDQALAINDSGAIVAGSNAGLVLLSPKRGCKCGHTLGPLVLPAQAQAGVPLQASVSFVDGDRTGTRSVEWAWGDGSSGAARKIVEEDGVGSASASHSFSTPGVYAVTATVVARDGRRTAVSQTVVVTGPAAPHDGTVPSNI
jgi:probable HAF family extracellular repeat protein